MVYGMGDIGDWMGINVGWTWNNGDWTVDVMKTIENHIVVEIQVEVVVSEN